MNNRNDLTALLMMQVIIILLKLANISPISYWSWVWVLSFMWIPFALGIIILGVLRSKTKDLGK